MQSYIKQGDCLELNENYFNIAKERIKTYETKRN